MEIFLLIEVNMKNGLRIHQGENVNFGNNNVMSAIETTRTNQSGEHSKMPQSMLQNKAVLPKPKHRPSNTEDISKNYLSDFGI